MDSLRGMSGNNSGFIAWLSSFIESPQDPTSAAQSLHLTIEPTLANEGALWFPDLLAGDPTGVLPICLTASILGNVLIGWKVLALEADLAPSKDRDVQADHFHGFVQGMPTALMLYWITSTNVATLQTWILDNKVFSPVNSGQFIQKPIAFEKPGDKDPFQLKNLR
ncbi:Membrane insertase OXA1/ALB3/YidC [Penicillium expansum]|nr:Membrane insertase OXA1/ALB3/YidC [Penicillium expansum]